MTQQKTKFRVVTHELQPETVCLVGVLLTKQFSGTNEQRQHLFQEVLSEAKELILATGAQLIETLTCKRDIPDSALYIGKGKVEELAHLVEEQQIDLVIFNHELTPTQERNLEKALQCRVLDRVSLILAIFAQRAQSQEGKIQVELAQLMHLSSRLVRGYSHLKSQKGGVGLKGPGETQLETDRRLIGKKITSLKKQLAEVKKQRSVRRKSREQSQLKTFALVGYTNTGKSSLFNRLTKSGVFAKNQLFATLDTTARRLYINEKNSIFLTDTVGFVRDLPHALVAAFAATLEETALADVLLHVVDVSHPEYERQIEDVNQVLAEIHADKIEQLMIYNKIDILSKEEQNSGLVMNIKGNITGVRISVLNSDGLDDLREAIIAYNQSLA